MKEADQSCYLIGEIKDQNLAVIAQDIHLVRGDKPYVITVGTVEFLQSVVDHNRVLTDDDPTRLDDKVFILDKIVSIDQICATLSRLPLEELRPYLTEQKTDLLD